ncbi:TonB-dependent receptor [Flavitalea sp. BT771]|uniref:TonB-dependent receptor n=1 Tax=Flavitalea sp. BT771 TaxID=3063329 RepID=UPI0026E1A5B3|nr:TonB-dependent receptor [Flavitalea sp. BT771]MDO6434890.1 TonB-dependent receptor [Flavitalea sp. BT771]MDV6223790.1 TonB-dependent receptor [Flavitalea sp. BT771]
MKHILQFVLLIILSLNCLSQPTPPENHTGAITGTVTTSDGKPAQDVSVHIKTKAALTDDKGQFTFSHLAPGTYELNISLVGHAPVHQQVTVEENKTTTLSLRLQVSEQQLDEVTVTTGHNKFNKKETDDVARMPLKNIENPQVYSVVTKEIMREQVITDYNSIFKNVPGAGVPLVYNQGRSSLLARGFTTANLIRNSISGFVYTNIDPANLERLEAIKGPSGTLFNSSMISFGGLFNRVTKKPLETSRTEISYTGASFDLNRLTFDVNRPLNDAKTVLFRVNGALHTENSFQDAGFTRNLLLAPSFVFKANDRLTFLLDIEASTFNATSPIRFTPAKSGKVTNIRDLGMDYKRSFTNNTLDYTTRQLNVFGQINYQLSSIWKSQTNYTRTFSTTEGYVSQLIGKSDSTLQQSVQKENFPYNGTEIQQNFIGDMHIAGLRNRIVIGLDYYNQKSDRTTPTINMPVINFRHPGAAYNNFNTSKVDSLAASAVYSIYKTNQNTYGAYVSDVLNITPQLNIMLSLRADRFEDKGTYYPASDSTAGAFTQNALSPKLGIVYEVVKDKISLFGNYMNGFSNTGGTDFNGVSFKPQQANQWETGIKLDVFNHRLSSTISYYNIDVSNVTRDDPDHAGYSIQDGTQLSKGIETEIIANPFAGFNLVAGYTYNDSKFTKANKTVQGLRPAAAGPANLLNIWASYHLMNGKAKGLGFGLGANYGSSSFQTNTTTQVFTIPSYTVLDATIFYDQPGYRLGIKVDNLTNEKYWSFRLAPQNPTRISASISLKL